MLKKTLIIAVLAIVVVASTAVALILLNGSEPPRQATTEDFEGNQDGGLGEWNPNADVPPDPNNPGNLVQWHIRLVTDFSHSPTHSAEFFIDGTQDDGTIWLERKINVEKNTRVHIALSFWLYSEDKSDNTLAALVAYVGASQPRAEEDFAEVGYANEVAGWKNYSYSTDVSTDSTGEAYIAVGLSVLWETRMTYYIDDISIE